MSAPPFGNSQNASASGVLQRRSACHTTPSCAFSRAFVFALVRRRLFASASRRHCARHKKGRTACRRSALVEQNLCRRKNVPDSTSVALLAISRNDECEVIFDTRSF